MFKNLLTLVRFISVLTELFETTSIITDDFENQCLWYKLSTDEKYNKAEVIFYMIWTHHFHKTVPYIKGEVGTKET